MIALSYLRSTTDAEYTFASAVLLPIVAVTRLGGARGGLVLTAVAMLAWTVADLITGAILEPEIQMTKSLPIILYVLAMIFVIVGADLLFFKYRFWERLMFNIGIVLVFGAFYLRFLQTP